MTNNFWLEKWQTDEIPFHENEANPLLVKYFHNLALQEGTRVFLPLCGKTSAIRWLLTRGCQVVGSELSEIAIRQLFADLGVKPAVAAIGDSVRFSAENIDIFVGDFFSLSSEILERIDGVYDRAALVALSSDLRSKYSSHLTLITRTAPQLLITFKYDQGLLEGPPFSIDGTEVKKHYQESYSVKLLATVEVKGGLKGKCPAVEEVWLLKPPSS